ncbi:GNAT family N-acetyltransferase [Muriicola marianensis]|uniref:N-acetyltransferase n=1 Tax=Muriicola marianensis TaxID=1324801 RepID=A0ABQ1QW07_9FLAO|nr:GNAT family N-acetyltransferase [Muriicola marianensis]GGD47841.1 N-acetyltransferase [Muriicola marianensis]
MKIDIREARPSDMTAVLDLIKELAHFEREPDAVEISSEELVEDGFGKDPCFTCFIGEVDGSIGGMALVYPRYSTWKGKVIHLEDLIVKEKYRGQGLGNALLERVVQYGHDLGVKRISWEVLDWNEPAISFYERKGARVMRDWDVVQLDEQGIEQFLKNR